MIPKKKFLTLFGEHVKKLREEKELTQGELGSRMNRKQQSVQRLEAGNINPTFYFLHELAEALEVDVKVLNEFKHK